MMLERIGDGQLLAALVVFSVAWATGVWLLTRRMIEHIPIADVPIIATLLSLVALGVIFIVPALLAVRLQYRIYRHQSETWERDNP